MPQISEVQVGGIPDVYKGQEVVACIKVKKDAEITIQDVIKHCKRRLPKWQWSGFYKLVSKFPMTRSGKLQKFKLSEILKETIRRNT